MELAYPQHRGKLTTLYNTLWYIGSIIAAWTVYGTINYTGNIAWRVPVAVQAAMPVIQLIGIFLLPESPRWLCAKDRGSEAMAILVKVRGIFLQHEIQTDSSGLVSRGWRRKRCICQR
jgi:MFS family permease